MKKQTTIAVELRSELSIYLDDFEVTFSGLTFFKTNRKNPV